MGAAISCEMKRMGERQFRGAGYCDENVNRALMEIATGQRSCLQCLGTGDEDRRLESVICGTTAE